MSTYRRYFVPGGTYFFTVVTHLRRTLFAEQRCRDWLHQAISTIRATRPFDMPAVVLMPEHLHAIWTLPQGDAKYSTRWRRIKEEFTQAFLDGGGRETPVSAARRRRGLRGVWQLRFWEHTIDDEHDFERHFDYIHYNPVKHGLVSCPRDWPHSSFHRWVEQGVYGLDWGRSEAGPLSFDDLDETAME